MKIAEIDWPLFWQALHQQDPAERLVARALGFCRRCGEAVAATAKNCRKAIFAIEGGVKMFRTGSLLRQNTFC